MSDAVILEEIRENFTSDTDAWREIRDDGQKDMRYIAGDPWDADDKKARKAAGRPCLALDELGQYVNQVINNLRQNKRGLKASPVGGGANDQTALFLQGKIRDIEYRSNAQQAYTTMAENAIQRSYGFLRIKPRYVSQTGHDQELVIEPIVNPDMVTPDPFALRPDGSDMRRLTFHESLSVRDFKREYPGATVQDFDLAAQHIAPLWIKPNRVQVAEYWSKEPNGTRNLLTLKPANDGDEPTSVYEDELKGQKPSSDRILKAREIDRYKVVQYVTNGLEILKRADWPGTSIPFVTCYGKILYVDDGSGAQRKMLSLVRLARDPYMLYCYYRTCEAELVGMTPKFPYFAYEGQLSPDELLTLQKSLHEPVAVVLVKPMLEGSQQPLGFPQRQPYEPPIQSLEAGAEAARRAIQAAMGGSPLPTQAQRHNDKSGVALKQIEDSAQIGSFHYVDHYDESITRTGQLLAELIPHYYDTARDTSFRKADDSVAMVRINDPRTADAQGQPLPHVQGNQDAGLQPHVPVTKDAEHDVTISVGPAMASERDAANQFFAQIIGTPEIAQIIGPQKMAEVLAVSIKAQNLGPYGDEIVEIISPSDPQNDPKQLAQQAAQMQQQMQDMGQKLQQAGQIIQTKQVEAASREKIVAMQIASKEKQAQADREVKIAVAELGAKVDRLSLFMDERARIGLQAADIHAQASEQAHDVGMAALQHGNTLEQGQAATDNQATLADQGHQNALEQGAQAAALQPPPADQGAGA